MTMKSITVSVISMSTGEDGITDSYKIYEGSPEYPTENRPGFYPSIFVGHCIEGTGDTTIHKSAPRDKGAIDFRRR